MFSAPNYETTIYDTTAVGTVIFNNISGSDADGDSLRFSIVGEAHAIQFYEIHPDTAVICLTQSLYRSTQAWDIIQQQVSDQRNLARTPSATATVNIINDNGPSRFTNLVNNSTVPYNNFVTIRATNVDLRGNLTHSVTMAMATSSH